MNLRTQIEKKNCQTYQPLTGPTIFCIQTQKIVFELYDQTRFNISLPSILSYVIMPKKKKKHISLRSHFIPQTRKNIFSFIPKIKQNKGGTKIRLERQQESTTSW